MADGQGLLLPGYYDLCFSEIIFGGCNLIWPGVVLYSVNQFFKKMFEISVTWAEKL